MGRGCREKFVELKMGGQSWFVKVIYYPRADKIYGRKQSGNWKYLSPRAD